VIDKDDYEAIDFDWTCKPFFQGYFIFIQKLID